MRPVARPAVRPGTGRAGAQRQKPCIPRVPVHDHPGAMIGCGSCSRNDADMGYACGTEVSPGGISKFPPSGVVEGWERLSDGPTEGAREGISHVLRVRIAVRGAAVAHGTAVSVLRHPVQRCVGQEDQEPEAHAGARAPREHEGIGPAALAVGAAIAVAGLRLRQGGGVLVGGLLDDRHQLVRPEDDEPPVRGDRLDELVELDPPTPLLGSVPGRFLGRDEDPGGDGHILLPGVFDPEEVAERLVGEVVDGSFPRRSRLSRRRLDH